MLSNMLTRAFGHPVEFGNVAHWVGWNVFLAVIPVGLAYLFLKLIKDGSARKSVLGKTGAVLVFLAWLAFVPNTCYLLTEWVHFFTAIRDTDFFRQRANPHAVISAQILFYTLYSAAGVLCFVLAIRPIEQALALMGTRFTFMAVPLFFLIALGVYLGRIPRLNSWDVVQNPRYVMAVLSHVPTNHLLLLDIVIFGALLWGLYEGLDIWVDGLVERRKRWFRRK